MGHSVSDRQPTTSSKMKLIIFAALLAVAVAAPAELDAPVVAIVSSRSEMSEDGSYSFAFESEDGVKVEESGSQKQIGETPEESGTVSKGSYSFTAPDGVVLTLTGLLMRTDSRPPVTIYPLPLPCPNMLSSFWLTWPLPEYCKLSLLFPLPS